MDNRDDVYEIYNALITVLYPLVIKRYINKRKENGKEDVKRFNERIGRPALKRPEGKLIWLHGASVGESVSMLPLIQKSWTLTLRRTLWSPPEPSLPPT